MLPDPARHLTMENMTHDSISSCIVCAATAIVMIVAFIELPTGLFLGTSICFILAIWILYAVVKWSIDVDVEDGLEEVRTEHLLSRELRENMRRSFSC